MPDYDPINLGKYVPRGMVELRDAFDVIVDAFAYMKTTIVGDMTLADYEQKYGSQAANLLAHFYVGLPSGQSLQMQCWDYLRHELVTGYVKAYVVDMSGAVNAIEHSFWVTDFAKVALSTGELPSTPSFPHGGTIVVMAEAHQRLFGKYFEYFVNEHWVQSGEDYITGVKGRKLVVPGPRNNVPRLEEVTPDDLPIPRGRGRPTLFDVEEFLIQAFLLLVDEVDPPSSQNELARRTADAYEQTGGPGGRPSPTWARAHTQRVWTALRAANNC